jgi:succinate dehydrogenase flavin-adding protein (antitoxin of CptAB toxin-antitoxin module)
MDFTDYPKPELTDTTSGETEWESSLDDLLGDLMGAFADVLLPAMIEEEVDEQRRLIESSDYCSAIIRQAAFVESLLQFAIIDEIESYRGASLSNSEQDVIEHMGNEPKVYMASALGLLTDSEYEAYTKLMGARNDVAHDWWMMFSEEEQEKFEQVAERVCETVESVHEDIEFS